MSQSDVLNRSIVGVSIALNALAILATWARVACRRVSKMDLGADDWTAVACLACSVGLGGLAVWVGLENIMGLSAAVMTPAQFRLYRGVQFVDILLVHFTFGLIKISVLLFYKRVFSIRKFKMTANILLAVVSAWMIASFCAMLGAGKQVYKYWATSPLSLQADMNIDIGVFVATTSAIDVALDVVIIVLPLTILHTLHMSILRKVCLTGIFLLGSLCVVASILRLKYALELLSLKGAEVATQRFLDLSLQQPLWTRVEAAVSVIGASLPTLGPMFGGVTSLESFLRRLGGRMTRNSSNPDSYDCESSSTTQLASISRTRDMKAGMVAGNSPSWDARGSFHENVPKGKIRVTHETVVS